LEEITNTKQHTEVSANGHVLYQMKPSEFLFPWRWWIHLASYSKSEQYPSKPRP